MALGAGLGEAGGDMVRIGGALIVLQMTAYTGSADQVEVVVDVAIGALTRWDGMSTGERETGGAMVELCIEPSIHAMAGSAVGGEATGNVVGRGGGLEVRGVTRVAVRG